MFFGYPLEKHTFQDFTGFWRKLKPISLARIPVFLSEIVVSKQPHYSFTITHDERTRCKIDCRQPKPLGRFDCTLNRRCKEIVHNSDETDEEGKKNHTNGVYEEVRQMGCQH